MLILHAIVELRVKESMTSLRLFGNPIFLNAALVGYVATVAMFRGRSALETGYILLAIAIPSGIATPLAGRLYDKFGPRMNLIVGFTILCIKTWQLSLIGANASIAYIIFLLALCGLAFGLTLQTSFVAAVSSVPLDILPRGSSLLNGTRFVVQAVSVTALATVLSSAVSPDIKAQQDQLVGSQAASPEGFGICETPGVRAEQNLPPGVSTSLASLSPEMAARAKIRILSTLNTVCAQSIQGFEHAYRITFFVSLCVHWRADSGSVPPWLATEMERA